MEYGVSMRGYGWDFPSPESLHEKRLRLISEFMACNHIQRMNILYRLMDS